MARIVPEGVAGSGGGEDGGDRGGRVPGLQADQRGGEGEGEGQHHQVHPRPEQDQWAQGSYLVTFSTSVVVFWGIQDSSFRNMPTDTSPACS